MQLNGVVQHTTLRLDRFRYALRLLVRSAVDELRNRVNERLHVPVRIEIDLIRQETGNDLNPAKLKVALLLSFHGIVQLVFMKVEDLQTHVHSECSPSSPSATRGGRKPTRTTKRCSLQRRYPPPQTTCLSFDLTEGALPFYFITFSPYQIPHFPVPLLGRKRIHSAVIVLLQQIHKLLVRSAYISHIHYAGKPLNASKT